MTSHRPGEAGRKPQAESRATELRQRLVVWKQIPEPARPSLRQLARELGTSHQLLNHYLVGLDEWHRKERYSRTKQQAQEIRDRANAEGRPMTPWEEQQFRVHDRAAFVMLLNNSAIDHIERISQEAERDGGLLPDQVVILKMYARQHYSEAHHVLQKYPRRSKPSWKTLELTEKQKQTLATLTPSQGEKYKKWLAGEIKGDLSLVENLDNLPRLPQISASKTAKSFKTVTAMSE